MPVVFVFILGGALGVVIGFGLYIITREKS